ncbi:hypothetical protein ACJZ2D_000519 [Fusarium nematophilum]
MSGLEGDAFALSTDPGLLWPAKLNPSGKAADNNAALGETPDARRNNEKQVPMLSKIMQKFSVGHKKADVIHSRGWMIPVRGQKLLDEAPGLEQIGAFGESRHPYQRPCEKGNPFLISRLKTGMSKFEEHIDEIKALSGLSGTSTLVDTPHMQRLVRSTDELCNFPGPGSHFPARRVMGEDDDALFLAYFTQAHSVLQVASQIRQLIVTLNPFLRDNNAYLADRLAYHYATQVYKLDQWRHLIQGIRGLHESQLFKPFVCTSEPCSDFGSFSSLSEWAFHIDERHRKHPRYEAGMRVSLDLCEFCGAKLDSLNNVYGHIGSHLLVIGQEFLQESWKVIEADPGASLGIWQSEPVELDASESRTKAKANTQTPRQKEKNPEVAMVSSSRQADKKDSLSTSLPTVPKSPLALPNQGTTFKQIGKATIQVKMVISPGLVLSMGEQADESNSEDGLSEYDPEAPEAQDADYDTNRDRTAGGNWSGGFSSGQQSSGSGGGSGSAGTGAGIGEGSGAGEGDRRGKKRRKGENGAYTFSNRPRLACPYQVFEPTTLGCFRREIRNPDGGCENLSRLRQHQEAADCIEKTLPDFERLMDVEDEPAILMSQARVSEENAWWAIFQRLIPGMAARDIESLKLEYSPYYVHRDTSIVIPAVNISDALFAALSSQSVAPPSDIFANSMGSMGSVAEAIATQGDSLTFISQDLSVPVFQGLGPPSLGSIPEVAMSSSGSTSSLSAPSSDQSSLWTQAGTSNPATTSPSLASPRSIPGSLAGGISQTQLEKNHSRLKTQYNQVKMENAQLRQDKFANRGDLDQAETVLEEVLNSPDVSGELFERLSHVSEILMGMKLRMV